MEARGVSLEAARPPLVHSPRSSLYRGRGAFESMGAGLAMAPGDVAFKCNLASLAREGGGGGEKGGDPATTAAPDPAAHPTPVVAARRAGRDFEVDGPALCAALDGVVLEGHPGVAVRVRHATEHRAGVVLSAAGGLSDAVTGTDPLKDGLRLRACAAVDASDARANATAAAVDAASAAFRRVLATHPVNAARIARGVAPADALLMRGAGVALAVRPFLETAGWAGACVAPTRIIKGLTATLGMDDVTPEGATGDYSTDLGAKAAAAAARVAAADANPCSPPAFILLHIKAADDAGHDRDARLKVGWLSAADAAAAALVAALTAAPGARRRTILAITADHSTPVDYGDHSTEPVPFAAAEVHAVAAALGGRALAARAAAASVRPAAGDPLPPPAPPGAPSPSFDEVAAAGGCLGRFPGAGVVPLLRALAAAWGGGGR